MIIRFGIYTFVKGIEMTVTEYYGHGLNQEIGENHRIISYSIENGPLEGFKLDEAKKVFLRDILLNELSNAFHVITKAIYQNSTFIVEPGCISESVVLKSNDCTDFEKMNYIEYLVGDEKKMSEDELYRTRYFRVHGGFIINAKMKFVSKLWEERSKSHFNLPMPEGLPLYQEIDLSSLNE